MTTFEHLWQLLYSHGAINSRKGACADEWDKYTLEQQRQIYATIHRKIQNRQFVHYDPVRAIQEVAPKQERQVMTFNDYYARFGTTEEQGGWKMTNPTGNQVIYVKN